MWQIYARPLAALPLLPARQALAVEPTSTAAKVVDTPSPSCPPWLSSLPIPRHHPRLSLCRADWSPTLHLPASASQRLGLLANDTIPSPQSPAPMASSHMSLSVSHCRSSSPYFATLQRILEAFHVLDAQLQDVSLLQLSFPYLPSHRKMLLPGVWGRGGQGKPMTLLLACLT